MQEIQVQSPDQKDPLEEEMATTPVFLPGESHGQRSLRGYSPKGCKELDTTEHACIEALWLKLPNIKYIILTIFNCTVQWY